jgi:alpha-N-acetylglucosamine transferase
LALTPSTAWVTLITNTQYLPGLLVLEYSLRRVRSRYPLVALFTDSFPEEGHHALNRRGIPKQRVEFLLPRVHRDYSNDTRFYDCWSKLAVFSLTQYDRLILLDADMLVVKNMDELMDLDLGPNYVFAASHACLCNPLKKPHYPRDWVPENCPYTLQHSDREAAQTRGVPPASAKSAMPNSGLVVLNPSSTVNDAIMQALGEEGRTSAYDFPDQALLGDVFSGRWMALPYVYNGLKTLRWPGVHDAIWLDDRVKNLHYGLTPKPWQVDRQDECVDELEKRWWDLEDERAADERQRGVEG